jgi:hypothetical protein
VPRSFTTNGWCTGLKKNGVGVWLRVVSNMISTGRAISISPSVRRLTGHPAVRLRTASQCGACCSVHGFLTAGRTNFWYPGRTEINRSFCLWLYDGDCG